jgi:WD40 repeat protein
MTAATRFDDSGSGTMNANTNTNGVSVSSAAWGPGGARFAAGGSDGATAVWRSDQFLDASASPASFRAPPSPGKSRVEAIAFASAAAVAAVGSHLDSRDGRSAASLVLWDTLRPSRAPPAAAAAAHEGGATALCWLPGFAGGASPWPLLATAGRDGDIAAHDLRKLSCAAGAQTSVLWRARRVDAGVGHAAAVKALAVVANPRGSVGSPAAAACGYLVSGCKDGDVRVWSCASGAHAQHFAAAHERHTFLAPRGGGRNVLQVGVSKLVPLARGALSCGGDGTVKLFRLAPEAFEADRGAF